MYSNLPIDTRNIRATNTDTATSGSFSAFTAPDKALGGFMQTSPAGASTNVTAGIVGQNHITTAQNITGAGHIIGVLGMTDRTAAGTSAAHYAVEGRLQATAGTQTVGACFIAAAQTVTEGAAGAIGISVDYYSPTFSDHAHMPLKFGYYNSDSAKICRNEGTLNQRGALTMGAGDRAVAASPTRCTFNGTGTPALINAFNVTSITDNGVGDYTLNYTSALANATYCIGGFGVKNAIVTNSAVVTTTSCRIETYSPNGTLGDGAYQTFFVIGGT